MKIVLIALLGCSLLISCSPAVRDIAPQGYDMPHAEIFEDSGMHYHADDFDWVETPESTCFEYIGYDYEDEYLCVCFRDSGAIYVYTDVPESVWDGLYAAESRGGFYNSEIKGKYPCERIRRET